MFKYAQCIILFFMYLCIYVCIFMNIKTGPDTKALFVFHSNLKKTYTR